MLHIKLRELRNKLNLTQKEVAEKLGIKRERYTQYEMGKRVPRGEMLIQIANFYNVTTDFLLEVETEDICPILEERSDIGICLHTVREKLQSDEELTYFGKKLDKKIALILCEAIDSQERIIKAMLGDFSDMD